MFSALRTCVCIAANATAVCWALTVCVCVCACVCVCVCHTALTGRVMAAAMTTHWVCNVAVGQTFMGLVAQYGLGTVYTGFGLVALMGALYIMGQV